MKKKMKKTFSSFLCRFFLDCHVNILFITNSECVKSHNNTFDSNLNECPFKATVVATFIPQMQKNKPTSKQRFNKERLSEV